MPRRVTGPDPPEAKEIRLCSVSYFPNFAHGEPPARSLRAMRRPASFLLGLSAAAALHPLLRLAARRPLAVAVRMSSPEELSKRTVVQLKEQLRAAGLPVSGRKAELVDRLLSAAAPAATTPSPFSAVAVPAAAPSVPLAPFASSGTVVPTNTARSGRAYPPIAIEACKS